MQHGAGIAQTVDAVVGREQVRINTRHLRRDVGADAELAAAELIDQADGFER